MINILHKFTDDGCSSQSIIHATSIQIDEKITAHTRIGADADMSYIGCDLKTGCSYINRERDKQTRLTYSTHSPLPVDDVRKTNDAGGQEIAALGRLGGTCHPSLFLGTQRDRGMGYPFPAFVKQEFLRVIYNGRSTLGFLSPVVDIVNGGNARQGR